MSNLIERENAQQNLQSNSNAKPDPPIVSNGSNMMESELLSLQQKIMDLESKLNYDNDHSNLPNTNQNAGSGESGDPMQKIETGPVDNFSKYRNQILSGIDNVIFNKNPEDGGIFGKNNNLMFSPQYSELRPKTAAP